MNEIRFYRSNEKPFGVFSNLYRRPIVFDGEIFPTAEHAYQAGKPRKPEVKSWLMSAHGLYSWDISSNWATSKFDRMRAVLLAKFASVLLSTGDAKIIESATVDNPANRLWAEVAGKGGKNMLGTILMEVRGSLRA